MNKVRARGMHLPLFWGILAVVFFLFLRDPAKTGQWMARGLSVAVYKALPAVFPYLILSSLFFKSGFPALFCGRVSRAIAKTLNIPTSGVSALLMGVIAGFPLGASCTAQLYQSSLCTREEAERLSAICNFCAPPFLLGAFGVGVFGDIRYGMLLFAVQTVVALGYGILLGKRAKRARKESHEKEDQAPQQSTASVCLLFPLIGECIAKGALQMVRIGGYVLFFSLLAGVIQDTFPALFEMFPTLRAVVCGFFEISSGVAAIEEASALSFFTGALMIGWSGVSVHLQTASFLRQAGLSSKPYLLAHVLLPPITATLSLVAGRMLSIF